MVEVPGDTIRQCCDIAREVIGIAVNAANPALMIAAIGEFFEQLADLGQKDLGLLRCGLGLQADARHHCGPFDSPSGQLSLGRLKRELGGGLLGSGCRELGFQLPPSLGQIIVPLDHRLGLL